MREFQKLNIISNAVNKVIDGKYTLNETATAPLGIMVRTFVLHDYTLPESVLCIGRAGAGVNTIPLQRFAEEGVVVFNSPGANANAVKELVLMAMLLCGRRVIPALDWVRTLHDGEKTVADQVEKGKGKFSGFELMGKTLAVYGLGAIGMKVAETAVALGMKVVGYDPYLPDAVAQTMNPAIQRVVTLDELICDCDFITLHVPLTPETRAFINTERLSHMKDGVNIINCARGELVDNTDIIAAVKSGKVNRYVTDFANEELLNIDGIIALPHLGASTVEAEDNCAMMAAQQMVDYIEKGNIVNSVNYPRVTLPVNGKVRLSILFKENATEALKAKLAEMKKVVDYSLEVKKGFGAAVVNLTDMPCEKCSSALNGIEGVLRVRFI